jgi:hypothetical protein
MAKAHELVGRAAVGLSTHTGWAALVAVSGATDAPAIVSRARLEMIPGHEREPPRFVYHAAAKLELRAAERFVRDAEALSAKRATAALRAAIAELAERGHDVAATGIIVGNRPVTGTVESILASHASIHAAEGQLFRAALKHASEALEIPVLEVRARELEPQAAALLGIAVARLPDWLERIGRAAGRPWAKDQKDALLVALVASAGENSSGQKNKRRNRSRAV